jgi:tRNA U34 5-methylaminomethyl-2-thiouridine-forming methyltransferase MnmC
MATPEETRDRIKQMRDRIFKESDKDSAQNNIQETPQENNLAEKKHKVLQKNESPSDDTKTAEPKKASSSEKPQPYDDIVSLPSADTTKQISEVVLEFTNKLNSLETAILEKLEHTFSESNSKINAERA